MTVSRIDGTRPTTNDELPAGEATTMKAAGPPLPEPFAVSAFDDVFTAYAVMAMKMRSEQRDASDEERKNAAKELDAANAAKVAEMHRLADDTFAQGLAEGILEGAGAIASGAGAVLQFRGDIAKDAGDRAALARDANLLTAGAKGLSASSRLAGAIFHRDQELDRAATAETDARIDHAKSAEGAAVADKQRATEDLRDLLNAIRGYMDAKTKLGEAGVFKG